jgi:hypothetical protein
VDPLQLLFGVVLVIVISCLAVYYIWRQAQTLRQLRHSDNLSPEDRSYFHRQAWRRLVGCALLVILAGMLAGYFLFLEEPARHLADQGQAARERDETPVLDPAQRGFLNVYAAYVILALLVLMAIVFTAAFDLLAIRRYGLRHHRQIQADRRAMIERQAARLRSQRNGHT